MNNYNDFPGIEFGRDFSNPSIKSPNAIYQLDFYQTKESLMDIESYRAFLDNAVARFRKCITYRHYKSFLFDIGLDRCQIHGNITKEMATIEMHHNMITVHDIALIITEHTLNTTGKICTFDLVHLLKQVHTKHKVQLVMLSLTPHQIYHDDPETFISSNMCIGDWFTFLKEYNTGITQDLAFKILYYIDKDAQMEGKTNFDKYVEVRSQIKDWSMYNGY